MHEASWFSKERSCSWKFLVGLQMSEVVFSSGWGSTRGCRVERLVNASEHFSAGLVVGELGRRSSQRGSKFAALRSNSTLVPFEAQSHLSPKTLKP